MGRLSHIISVALLVAGGAAAAPDVSLRPMARETAPEAGALSQVRPVARPGVLEPALVSQLAQQFKREDDPAYQADPIEITAARALAFASVSQQATGLSLRPLIRPGAIVQKAMAQRRELARGAVCNNTDIQGEVVGFVPGRISGCGVQNAVRVRSVSGISLSQHAVMDCPTAAALNKWVRQGMKPAVGSRGGGVQKILVAAHYACRTRNSQPGARISEHGKGRAIDITGVRLRDGSQITLLSDWGRRDTGAVLRQMHSSACAVFGTVLGPNSNRFHRDHFHFDTARYRSGSFCR